MLDMQALQAKRFRTATKLAKQQGSQAARRMQMLQLATPKLLPKPQKQDSSKLHLHCHRAQP